jgi:hypothetical protein
MQEAHQGDTQVPLLLAEIRRSRSTLAAAEARCSSHAAEVVELKAQLQAAQQEARSDCRFTFRCSDKISRRAEALYNACRSALRAVGPASGEVTGELERLRRSASNC